MKTEELTGALHTVREALAAVPKYNKDGLMDFQTSEAYSEARKAIALIDKILAEYADIKKDYVSGYHDHNYMINSCMADFLATITQEPTK